MTQRITEADLAAKLHRLNEIVFDRKMDAFISGILFEKQKGE